MNEENLNQVAQEPKIEVGYITSLITAVRDLDNTVVHLQFTVVQETESKKMRCYFDVVDPSKVKISND